MAPAPIGLDGRLRRPGLATTQAIADQAQRPRPAIAMVEGSGTPPAVADGIARIVRR